MKDQVECIMCKTPGKGSLHHIMHECDALRNARDNGILSLKLKLEKALRPPMNQICTKNKKKYPDIIKNFASLNKDDLIRMLLEDIDEDNYACTRINKNFQNYWDKKRSAILEKIRQSEHSHLFSQYLENPYRYENKVKIATKITLFWTELWVEYSNIKNGKIHRTINKCKRKNVKNTCLTTFIKRKSRFFKRSPSKKGRQTTLTETLQLGKARPQGQTRSTRLKKDVSLSTTTKMKQTVLTFERLVTNNENIRRLPITTKEEDNNIFNECIRTINASEAYKSPKNIIRLLPCKRIADESFITPPTKLKSPRWKYVRLPLSTTTVAPKRINLKRKSEDISHLIQQKMTIPRWFKTEIIKINYEKVITQMKTNAWYFKEMNKLSYLSYFFNVTLLDYKNLNDNCNGSKYFRDLGG